MENASWWNEKLWKSFVDHPNHLVSGINEYERPLGGIRYTSQQSGNVKQLRLSNASIISTVSNIPNTTQSISSSNYQNTANLDYQSTSFQDNSTSKSPNPPIYSNNLFQQICSRPVMSNLHSIYGNRSRPLGSLRVYYLTRPHSAATVGRSVSLQRTTQELQNSKSHMNISSPLSTRRLANIDLCLSRENSLSTLLPGTTSSSLKRSNSIDCSGKICQLHERSATPSLCEIANKKAGNSNLCIRRRSATKTHSSLADTLQQKPQPPRRALSAYGSNKASRYGNRFINTFNADDVQSEYCGTSNFSNEPSQQLFTFANVNEFISLNSSRKFSYQSNSTNNYSPAVPNKVPDADNQNLLKSSVLSVTPLSFQNMKLYKYPTSPKRSSKPKLSTTSNKSEQIKPSIEQTQINAAPIYCTSQKTVRQNTASDDSERKLERNISSHIKQKAPVESKCSEINLFEEGIGINQTNNTENDIYKERSLKDIESRENTVITSEVSVTEEQSNLIEPLEEKLHTSECTKATSKFLVSDDQITVLFKNPDNQKYPSSSRALELHYSQVINTKLDNDNPSQSVNSENEDENSEKTRELKLSPCEIDLSSLRSIRASSETDLEQKDDEEPVIDVFGENISISQSICESIITEDEICEISPSCSDTEQIDKSILNDENVRQFSHNEPFKVLSLSESNNTEQLSYISSSSPSSLTQHETPCINENLSVCNSAVTNTYPIKSILKRSKSFSKSQTDNKATYPEMINDSNITGLTFYDKTDQQLSSKRPFSANSWKSEIPTNISNTGTPNCNEGYFTTNTSTLGSCNNTSTRPKSSIQRNKLYAHPTDKLMTNRPNKPGVRFDIKNNSIFEFYPHDVIYKS
ncbi:hypothetical protein EWB00_008412 [Schistosoma japonicum]|uniref:Uncharacterized protein n=2 Tax=Schistosoma japonicum TaxID=6182 RepID=A0A4Z2CQ42_SCHJA|nr:hypothetical protein EWB00_008412 [Schistosoma japonicum]